jgi:hypothetical protein
VARASPLRAADILGQSVREEGDAVPLAPVPAPTRSPTGGPPFGKTAITQGGNLERLGKHRTEKLNALEKSSKNPPCVTNVLPLQGFTFIGHEPLELLSQLQIEPVLAGVQGNFYLVGDTQDRQRLHLFQGGAPAAVQKLFDFASC